MPPTADYGTSLRLFELGPISSRVPTVSADYETARYPYSRADGVAVARPLFQTGGGGSIPTSALHLHFSSVGFETARALNALWHSVLPNLDARCSGGGPIPAQCYVAEFDDHWYATAIWTGPVNHKLGEMGDRILELRRFAIVNVAPRNTASRMLGYMVRDLRRRWPSLERLVSYQATAHHDGTIYKAAGWAPIQYSRFGEWTRNNRPRPAAQTISDKVRWELTLPPNDGSEARA